MCEETFKVIKGRVDTQQNSKITPERAFAISIDEGILSKVNRFDEVRISSVPSVRSASDVIANTHTAPLQKCKLPKAVADLKLNSIVSKKDTQYYSTTASRLHKPLAQMLAARILDSSDNLHQMETSWMAAFLDNNMIIQQPGQASMWLVVGDLFGIIVKCWPIQFCDDKVWRPVTTEGTTSKTFVCTSPDDFTAFAVDAVCPMHCCIKSAIPLGHNASSKADLKASHAYGKVSIGFAAKGRQRPFLEIAMRNGFGKTLVGSLIQLLDYFDGESVDNTLFHVLTALYYIIIPEKEQNAELLEEIYMARLVQEEPTQDEEDLWDCEFILEALSKEDEEAIEKEIDDSKKKKTTYRQYHSALKTWKVLKFIFI